ncbi:Zinc finger CCCH domain-containing protein like [Argiope bruennichi]|uniref:Zinc finger CCCH domain-containing protein like n=1 Tax=Argiope bruennichi TaxID=94029 RepID=A0A8T0FX28_ARGBR|nr:Zinc finger CCCH domain-containing protein like [Argiope bruennichi]
MATQSSLQDCYFYFYSSCAKGDECPFRHCELALGTETVCSLWREGRCFRSNCKFRHMESRINRAMIPCYWENQPGGCRKPHCVFLHRKLRNGVQVIKDTPGLILPTSDGKISPKLPDLNETSIVPSKTSLVEKVVEHSEVPDSSLTPVPPLVLSFDEGEESDAESVTSTPVKQGDKKTTITRNISAKASGAVEEKDFGIKTLEQIRMEKIHKESDSYYGTETEYLALPKDSSLDKNLPSSILETKLSGVDEETDLRGRLSNKRNSPLNKVNSVKRLINFKKQNTDQEEVCSNKLDFKIKTLEEIRREKENKQNKLDVACSNSLDDLPTSEKKNPLNITTEKISKKLKINRKSKELYSRNTTLKQSISAPNSAETTETHLVSNGIKQISAGSLNEISNLNKTSDSPGKRKSDDEPCSTASKIIKLATTSKDNCDPVNRVDACFDRIGENLLQSLPEQSEMQSSPAPNEATDESSHFYTSSSSILKQDTIMIPQSFVSETERNDVLASAPTSLSSSTSPPSHSPEEKSWHALDEIHDKTLNSSALPTSIKNEASYDNDLKKDKDNLIDRSMSVDDDLDELLGDDDMNIDEMDTAPNDDILLEIEEFLES